MDGQHRQTLPGPCPVGAHAANRRRHPLPDHRRAARPCADRQPRRPGRRRHRLRLLPDRRRGRRVARPTGPARGDRVIAVPRLQIEVTHPTVNIAGLDFNVDTIRNTLVVCAILLILGVILRSQLRVGVPTQLQNAMEAIVEYINNLTEETLQGRNVTLGPLAITLITFLLVANWLGLVPGLKSPTNDWNTTLGLALMSFVLVQYYSIRSRHLGGYFKHLLLVPPYFPLTVIDELAKPITLSFRLYFNIFVGELLLTLIIVLIPTWISWLPGALWTLFSLFIGAVQAFIFTVLTVSYVAIATEVEEGHG
ncbi:MAG: F0F1 ATP synthase subunit A [Chloroflexi bacterium]|nr:MAG: F0F1 ATP synthase subunit A [Chloroflexota bacterium]